MSYVFIKFMSYVLIAFRTYLSQYCFEELPCPFTDKKIFIRINIYMHNIKYKNHKHVAIFEIQDFTS